MSPKSYARILTALAVACAIALPGCATPHSQQVRNDARDRFDRAGAAVVYDQARQSFSSGQFDDALGHINRAIGRFPKDASYHLLRGRILSEMKRMDQARESFVQAIEIDPRKAEPHYFLGIVYQRWRQMDDALREYSKAAELDPATLHYLSAEVEVLTVLGKYAEAEKILDEVNTRFEFSPILDRLRSDVAKCRGDNALAAEMLDRVSVREEATPDALSELAFARFSNHDFSGTLNALDEPTMKTVAARPDMVRLRARCLLMLDRSQEALDALMTVRAQPDRDGRTLVLLGNAAWRVGDWQRVRDCGQTLVRVHPTLADGYLFLGGADFAAGRLAKSVTHFEQAVSRDPERESARRLLAESSARLADGGLRDMEIVEPASAGVVRNEAP